MKSGITYAEWNTGRMTDEKKAIQSALDLLRCPSDGEALVAAEDELVTVSGRFHYRLNAAGVPLFAETPFSTDGEKQRVHYDRVAAAYVANLTYPHTQEYVAYLDRLTLEAAGTSDLGTTAEICCGRGEALDLFGRRIKRYVGVDISENMLSAAVSGCRHPDAHFIQGDATRLPLADSVFDTVTMLGGIHHVRARAALFSEIARVLKPGGLFLYREPVSDFFLWRAMRALIYRLSPALDHTTERPLRFEETVPVLASVGLEPALYRTCGFLGFCVFMNSDVLVVNRWLRFLPGIRAITRSAAAFDDRLLALPGMKRAGLQVIGTARKPPRADGPS